MARLSNEARSMRQAADHLDAAEPYIDFLLLWAKREIVERRRVFDMDGEARVGELSNRVGELIKHVQRAQRSLDAGQQGAFIKLPVCVDGLLRPVRRNSNE